MPEGPSTVILRQQAAKFRGKVIRAASGNSKVDKTRLVGQRVVSLRSFGKQFLIETPVATVRIHLLMFGRYRVDECRPDREPRLHLQFARGQLNFYSCSVRYLEAPLDALFDARAAACGTSRRRDYYTMVAKSTARCESPGRKESCNSRYCR